MKRSVTPCHKLGYPHNATGKFNWDREIRTMEHGAVTLKNNSVTLKFMSLYAEKLF